MTRYSIMVVFFIILILSGCRKTTWRPDPAITSVIFYDKKANTTQVVTDAAALAPLKTFLEKNANSWDSEPLHFTTLASYATLTLFSQERKLATILFCYGGLLMYPHAESLIPARLWLSLGKAEMSGLWKAITRLPLSTDR